MRIEIQMGSNYQQTIGALGSMASSLIDAVDDGLKFGAIDTAAYISESKLTGQKLKVRSSRLRREVKGDLIKTGTAFVGIKSPSPVDDYAYLLMDEDKIIRPKTAKRLAIPLAAAMTTTGQPRYPEGPKSVDNLFYLKTKKGTELLMLDKDKGKDRGVDKRYKNKRKKKRRIIPMFVLKESVTVKATNALPEGVTEKVPDITKRIQDNLDKLITN